MGRRFFATVRFSRASLVVAGLAVTLAAGCSKPPPPGEATSAIAPARRAALDAALERIIQRDHVPGLSLAIALDDRLAYVKGFGYAKLPRRRVAGATRFAIGSVTKQMTAAAILLLADRGKLSLDDPVGNFLPHLTGAKSITIRQILSHMSGYEDYLWQEYLPARVRRPTSVQRILGTWGERPLDFAPGTRWQYSGTNYVIAGRIIEIASGMSYENFIQRNILRPSGITDAFFVDEVAPSGTDAVGYYRFGLGPPRVAPRAGRNWLFAIADLAMTAEDVAKWDLSVLDGRILSRASYEAMTSDARMSNGESSGYGLGLFIGSLDGTDGRTHPLLYHPGEISGFRAENWLLPDAKSAVVVLTNAEFSAAPEDAGAAVRETLALAAPRAVSGKMEMRSYRAELPETAAEHGVRTILERLARGHIDRSRLSADARAMMTRVAVHDLATSLAKLGRLHRVTRSFTQFRAGLEHDTYAALYDRRIVQVEVYTLPNDTIGELFIDAPR